MAVCMGQVEKDLIYPWLEVQWNAAFPALFNTPLLSNWTQAPSLSLHALLSPGLTA